MASSLTVEKFRANNAAITYDHDPGSTAAMITSPDGGTTKRYLPMKDFGGFFTQVMATVVTTGPTLVEIVAATDAAGTDVTQIVSSGVVAADAVGDGVSLECSAEQIKEVGDAAGKVFTHVGTRITCGHAGDECSVLYLRYSPRFAGTGLTSNFIS